MPGTIGKNRLYPDEQALLDAARRWFRYRTTENLKHLLHAARDWIRAEHRRTDPGPARRGK